MIHFLTTNNSQHTSQIKWPNNKECPQINSNNIRINIFTINKVGNISAIILSFYNPLMFLVQAEVELPLSGYDTVKFYILPTTEDGQPAQTGLTTDNKAVSN